MRKLTSLNVDNQRNLYAQANTAMSSGMWALPRTVAPMTEDEVRFLRTHTLDQLLAAQGASSMSPFCRFLVQVVASVAADLATQAFENALEPSKSLAGNDAKEVKKSSAQNTASQDQKAVAHTYDRVDSKHSIQQTEGVSLEPKNGSDVCSEESTSGVMRNPEIEHIRRTVEGKSRGLGGKAVSEALMSGATDPETQRFYASVRSTLGAGVAAATYLTKVEENGVVSATTELVKNTLIDQFAKHSASGLAKLVGSANPAGLGLMMSLVIKDVFTPTETVPDYLDRRPPPCPPAGMPKVSGMPNLDMPYPTLRNPW